VFWTRSTAFTCRFRCWRLVRQLVESDLNAFTALHNAAGKTDDKHRIMIGPGRTTCRFRSQGIDLGLDSSAPIRAYQIEWFDHWLKGTPESRRTPRGMCITCVRKWMKLQCIFCDGP